MVVLVAKNGTPVYQKAFGYLTYDSTQLVSTETMYDLASITKILATTLAIMKLYDDNLIELNDKVSDYLLELKNIPAGNIRIKNLLTHHSGLPPVIPIHKEALALQQAGNPLFSKDPNVNYPLTVTNNLHVSESWSNAVIQSLKTIRLNRNVYVYSDVGFIILGKIVERISQKSLNDFMQYHFYEPLNLYHTGFNGICASDKSQIAPTENDTTFRKQLIQGTVHDPVAAMMGGTAGHAGLFSNANEVFVLMQMLLNKGIYNDICFINDKTIELFTK